ncbi:hypothetical protein [Devosia sp.]|uniref:hypothetical protein n=1 Tax=Devosia sp. TaxID=1871048 RepID=UPI0035AE59C9
MPVGRLLVIAPDSDLRHSLVFALEAEGFEVTERAQLPSVDWAESNRFDCTVLDHKAVRGAKSESIAFCIKAAPVVLLASRPLQWLADFVAETVETPVIGNALLVAVRLAIHLPTA